MPITLKQLNEVNRYFRFIDASAWWGAGPMKIDEDLQALWITNYGLVADRIPNSDADVRALGGKIEDADLSEE